MPMSNNGRDKLIEELGELIQALGKYAAYPEGPHPDGGPPLLQRISDEMGDVLAAIRFMCATHGVCLEEVEHRAEIKLAKFQQWHTGAKLDPTLRTLVEETVAYLEGGPEHRVPRQITACPGYHKWIVGGLSNDAWVAQLVELLQE